MHTLPIFGFLSLLSACAVLLIAFLRAQRTAREFAAQLTHAREQQHHHKMQLTERSQLDTLKEASSWGKVDLTYEQMVFSEATIALPLIAGYAFHKNAQSARRGKSWAQILDQVPVTA